MRRAMQYLGLVDDDELDDEYYDGGGGYYDDAPAATPAPPSAAESPAGYGRSAPPSEPTGVSGLRPVSEGASGAPPVVRPLAVAPMGARVHVLEPHGFNDAQEVGDRLKGNQPVILNLQGVDRELQRRLIDFSSGLAYALGGRMSKAADQVFLLTPSNVSVPEEEKDRLEAEGLYRR